MFRVTFFVDDKKLGDCLRTLTGIAHGQPEVQPVVNAEPRPNGGALQARTNGKLEEMFMDWVRKNKLDEISSHTSDQFLKSIGSSPGSRQYVMQQLEKTGLIKRTGEKLGLALIYKVMGGSKSHSKPAHATTRKPARKTAAVKKKKRDYAAERARAKAREKAAAAAQG